VSVKVLVAATLLASVVDSAVDTAMLQRLFTPGDVSCKGQVLETCETTSSETLANKLIGLDAVCLCLLFSAMVKETGVPL